MSVTFYVLRITHHTTLVLLLVLLCASMPPASAAAAPPREATPITATPVQVAVDVPLGEQRAATVTLTNTGTTTISPLIYEAQPAPPTVSSRARPPASLQRVALPQQAERLDARLPTILRAAPGGTTDFLVYLPDQADLSAAYAISDWNERGRYVYEILTAQAARAQQPLRQWLAARSIPHQSLWIVNALLVHGSLADAQALATRGDVALVRANTTVALPQPPPARSPDQCSPDQPANPICWNIRAVGADRVWRDFGITGRGVVVASIDTGARLDHPALALNYRGRQPDGTFDHNYNWFDPQRKANAPTDQSGHGTHTIGTLVGAGNGTPEQPAIGVAPDAAWITAQGCENDICTDADLITAAQWLLAPTRLDGSAPRPDLRPMIVNNSWSGAGGQSWYAGYIAAWRAAGIFPVFAAGNTGAMPHQTCGGIGSPADYPDVVAVGAVDQADTITSYSLFGPSKHGQIKPDFVAPGSALLSAAPGDGADYRVLQGTSMAAPHVAGVVALLWSARPELIGDYTATYAVLRDSAQPLPDDRCGSTGVPNNITGYGRVDAFAAVARVRVDVPWLDIAPLDGPLEPGQQVELTVTLDASRVSGPGVYSARLQVFDDLTHAPVSIEVVMNVPSSTPQALVGGRVRGADTRMPVQATIIVDDSTRVMTDRDGVYTVELARGEHTLEVSALSYMPLRRTITITESSELPDILLEPEQPRVALASAAIETQLAFAEQREISIPISNTGAITLYYQLNIPPNQLAFWRSDEPGGPAYEWRDLPPDAPRADLSAGTGTQLPLGFAFPLHNDVYTQTLLAPDGTLVFGPFADMYQPRRGCLPDRSAGTPFIAPFRAALDLAQGGAVRYGNVGTAFVVSYENVVLQDTGDAVATFQVVLTPDGRIRLAYHRVDTLPAGLGVGVQHTSFESSVVGCGATTRLAAGLLIEFRPQPRPDLWLSTPTQPGELPPGTQQTIVLNARWMFSRLPQPRRALLEISSNDPLHQTLRVPIDATMRAAPQTLWFPLAGWHVQQR